MLDCKDCCLIGTDACRYGRYALEHNMSLNCDDFIVEHSKAYKQGKVDAFDRCIEIVRDGCYKDTEMLISFLEKERGSYE